MTASFAAGTRARPSTGPSVPRLDERENQRAVELIEEAERSATSCYCGAHTLAVAHGDTIWLECAEHDRERSGLAGLVARLTAFTHTRRRIMEVPTAN